MRAAGTRSIWLHQLAEYLIGAALVASGLQSPTPLVPVVVGGLIIANAAIVSGPLGAFALVGWRAHRVLDWVIVTVAFGTTAWPGVDTGTRAVQLGFAGAYTAVVWRIAGAPRTPSPPAPPPQQASPPSLGEAVGRAAGRATAKGIRVMRRWWRTAGAAPHRCSTAGRPAEAAEPPRRLDACPPSSGPPPTSPSC